MITGQRRSKLIFLVGVWRSGTSLLHAMLNNHPQIALLYEAELFGLYPAADDRPLPENWPARMEYFNQVISRHRFDPPTLPPKVTGREGLLALATTWAGRKNAAVMGDKSVACHMKLPALARIFPEADFIVLWRDPLDSCRSAINAGKQNSFFSAKGILSQTLFGSQQLADGILKLCADGRRVHEVVYEELIGDPEMELAKICRFIGLEFDPQMLALESADYSMLPPGEHHSAVRSGVVKKKTCRAEVLPARFIAKGRRYAALWRKDYANLAFNRVLSAESETALPGVYEKWGDRIVYFGWRCLIGFKHRVLCRMPLSFWQYLRRGTKLATSSETVITAEKIV